MNVLSIYFGTNIPLENHCVANFSSLKYLLTACNATPPSKLELFARGPQDGWQSLKAPGLLGARSHQLLLNKFFDPSNPSMRKCCDGKEEKKRKGEEKNC